MNAFDYLNGYYSNYDEDHRLDTRYGQIEYITTMKYIAKYLKDGDRILEIGAGTGRYSHTLARMGYEVDAVELISHNIEIFRKNTEDGEKVSITEGNATDLSAFAEDTYDVTLLLGPMYHLFTEAERNLALKEAVRVTKKGGTVFVAYCMEDPSIVQFGFIKGGLYTMLEKGIFDFETFKARSNPDDLFVLHRVSEIEEMRSRLPVTPLHLIATDGYANHMRASFAEMDDFMYESYIKYHLASCERPDLLGMSHHTLDIFRKDK